MTTREMKDEILFIPLLDKEGLGAVENTKAELGLQDKYPALVGFCKPDLAVY